MIDFVCLHQDSHHWKETYEANKQRLDFAEKQRAEAVKDTKKLQRQIKRQNNKLKSLREAKLKLERLEVYFMDIESENHSLRS